LRPVPELLVAEFTDGLGELAQFVAGRQGRVTLPLTGAPGLLWRPLRKPLLRRKIGVVVRARRSLAPTASRLLDILIAEAPRCG
jgi:hypothetical protein